MLSNSWVDSRDLQTDYKQTKRKQQNPLKRSNVPTRGGGGSEAIYETYIILSGIIIQLHKVGSELDYPWRERERGAAAPRRALKPYVKQKGIV